MSSVLDISVARSKLNSIDKTMRESGQHVIRVTRHGKPAFAIIDIDYLESLLETMEILSDPEAMKMLEQSLRDIEAGRVYDWEDVKADFF